MRGGREVVLSGSRLGVGVGRGFLGEAVDCVFGLLEEVGPFFSG